MWLHCARVFSEGVEMGTRDEEEESKWSTGWGVEREEADEEWRWVV